jgi:hypothetical protein
MANDGKSIIEKKEKRKVKIQHTLDNEKKIIKEFEFDSDYYFKRCEYCPHVDFGEIKRFYYPEWCKKYKKKIQDIQFCELKRRLKECVMKT